jgi:CubicO group peptidase (beta-lactamase class C family)
MKFLKLPLCSYCLLLFFLIQQANVVYLIAQSDSSDKKSFSNQIQERIKRVENKLLLPLRIKGESPGKMDIVERMKHYNVPGVSIAVINNGKIEWAKGYGIREAGTNLAVTTDTLFQAGSISKPVAAMAALKMVQDGKLNLDENVNNKLVSWKNLDNEFTKEQKVTLRRLLSHSAGTSISGFRGYPSDTKILPTVPQILDGITPANTKAVRVVATPGTRQMYSGGGFTIMQLLMTDVSGKPFAKLMNDTVLKKLGMRNSSYEQPLPQYFHSQASVGHTDKGEIHPGKWFDHPEMAAAGLWTTPSDVARFVIELQQAYAGKSKKVLSQKIAKQMLTRQMGGMGLGILLADETAQTLRFSHSGTNKGFSNYMIAYTETGQGAIVMTNGDNGVLLRDEIIRSVALEYGWVDYLAEEKTVVQLDPKILADYVGQYDFPANGKYTVLTEDNKLKVIGNNVKYELIAESETKFFIKQRPIEVVFVKDSRGRITEMILYFNGQEIRGKKL